MIVSFYWYAPFDDDFIEPDCKCSDEEKEVYMNFMHFLTDDEGLGVNHLIRWISTGLEEIKKIEEGKIDDFDMWGQILGAYITRDKVNIYWGDERVEDDIVDFDVFKIVLKRWFEFISQEPDINSKIEFSI